MSADGRPADPPPARGPGLLQAEVAWPAALLAGFAGSALGVVSRVPGLGALLATAGFAPLHLLLVTRGRPRLAGVLATGWLFAVGAAACGAVMERGFHDVAGAVPGARAFLASDVRPWLDGRAEPQLLRNAVVMAVLLAAALPTSGVATLLGLAAVASAVGACVGWYADGAAESAAEPLLLVLSGIPPHVAFAAVGGALLATAAAHARAEPPGAEPDPRRRELVFAGAGLLLVGLALEPILAPVWGRWVAGALVS